MRKYGYNTDFLDKDTPFRARFLGLFVTDGSMSMDSVRFGSTDKELIDQIVLETNYRNKITKTIKKDEDLGYKDAYSISFASPIKLKVEGFGYTPGKKSHKIFIPTEFLSDDTFPFFVQGVMEGDGCFYIFNQKQEKFQQNYLISSITSVCKAFLDQIFKELKRRKIVYGGWFGIDDNKVWHLGFSHQDSVNLGYYIYNSTNENTRLNRKYNIWYKMKDKKLKFIMQKGKTCSIEGCNEPCRMHLMCKEHSYKLIIWPNYYSKSENREKAKNRKKKKYWENRDEILQKNRDRYEQDNEYRENKLEKSRIANTKRYYDDEEYRKKVLVKQKEYREKNKKRKREYLKEYYQKNKETINKKTKIRNMKKKELANA